jgi:cell division protein FtsB
LRQLAGWFEEVALARLPFSTTQIVGALIALLIGYLLFTAAGDVLRTHRLNRNEDQLRAEIAELQRQHQELQDLRDYLATDDYIERVARQVLGLVKPGETLVVVSSSATPQPTPQPESDYEDRPWWEAIYDP